MNAHAFVMSSQATGVGPDRSSIVAKRAGDVSQVLGHVEDRAGDVSQVLGDVENRAGVVSQVLGHVAE